MHWMNDWPTPFPIVVDQRQGRDASPTSTATRSTISASATPARCSATRRQPVARAIRRQAGRGLTYMLPSEDALAVGRLLSERFGLPHWQIATTATDANRFALRVARAVTGRPKILVFNGCYHGSVDETMVRLNDGKPVNRPGWPASSATYTQRPRSSSSTISPALERALADRDVACVITEPVLTNCCMVLPEPGFHDGLRELTRHFGTLLLIDETHTISTGLGGYTRAHGLEPDLFVLGKPIAGGVPASVWGMSAEVAERYAGLQSDARTPGYSGMGTTLSANPLQFAAMRATLEEVMTAENYAHMERLAARLETGLSPRPSRATACPGMSPASARASNSSARRAR